MIEEMQTNNEQASQTKKKIFNSANFKKPTVLVLISANLIPVYGVLELNWDIFPIIFIYWLENFIVGCFGIIRIAFSSVRQPSLHLAKLFMIPFFCVHYGMFWFVHGVFVFALFGKGFAADGKTMMPNLSSITNVITYYHLQLMVLALILSHGFSFIWNFYYEKEYKTQSMEGFMGMPYQRVVVLHITILFRAFICMLMKSTLPALLILIGIKTSVDVVAHIKEHKKRQKGIQ